MNPSQQPANDPEHSTLRAGAYLPLYEKLRWNEQVSAVAEAHQDQVVVYDADAPGRYRLVSLRPPDVR